MSRRPNWLFRNHKLFERNTFILLVGILVVVAIGGIIEVAPLFYLKNTIEKVEGMRPYTPLELAGQNIYAREGCHVCHSQMIRPLRDEVERYGHYSLAAESMYDHPFLWGSKRTGPDLARVGGKYSETRIAAARSGVGIRGHARCLCGDFRARGHGADPQFRR
jgi:cytochrome c oxidase cbb3-type subunit II